jgi:hypothetical protein
LVEVIGDRPERRPIQITQTTSKRTTIFEKASVGLPCSDGSNSR